MTPGTQFIFAISEQFAILPACILALCPLVESGRIGGRQFVVTMSIVVTCCLVGGCLCASSQMLTNYLLLPATMVYIVLYRRFSGLDWPRTLFVTTSVLLVTAVSTYWAVVINSLIEPEVAHSTYLTWSGMVVQWALGSLFTIVLQYPARHLLRPGRKDGRQDRCAGERT